MKKKGCLCFDPREKIENKENPKEAEYSQFGRVGYPFETDDYEIIVNFGGCVFFSRTLSLFRDRQKQLGVSE